MCVLSSTLALVTTIVGVISTAVSTAIGVTSSIQQGNSQQAMYNYQAQVAEKNAKIAEMNAAQERQSGLEEARLKRIKTLQNIGNQQVAMAGNGIDITQGTALDTIEDTAQFGELDALMTQYNAERAALNYEQQADNFINQANLDKIAGTNAAKAGKISAIGYGVNGVADMAGGFGNLGKVSNKWTTYGKLANGSKIGQKNNNIYASLSSGLV